MHFDLSQFPVKHREKVKLSECRTNFCRDRFSPADWTTGVWGFTNFAAALAGLPFWMSTFTLVHHTKQNIPFHAADQWREVSQLSGTVHCDYPLVEVLCHDINVPHHISTIPPPIICSSQPANLGAYLHDQSRFSYFRLQTSVICTILRVATSLFPGLSPR